MTPLGKSLVFHLKYNAEMDLLWDDPEDGAEAPEQTGLADAEQARKMVRAVGTAADEQAADFLEICAKRIEAHFLSLGIVTLAKQRKRSSVVRNWSWSTDVHVSTVPSGSFQCGVFVWVPSYVRIAVDKEACGIVGPWFSSKGGRKGAEAVWKILDSSPDSRGGPGLTHESATVVLACIPFKAQPPESFDVDRDPLIEEVTKTFARIGVEQVIAIASLVTGLKKSEEE